jgi:hypothetical protein
LASCKSPGVVELVQKLLRRQGTSPFPSPSPTAASGHQQDHQPQQQSLWEHQQEGDGQEQISFLKMLESPRHETRGGDGFAQTRIASSDLPETLPAKLKVEVPNENWQKNLRTGDLIDARDEFGTWYESVVSSVDTSDDSVTIHFRGWGTKFDRTLSIGRDLNSNIAPPYTKTENWRDWLKVSDRVDYTNIDIRDQARKWMPAYVMPPDPATATGLLKLKYFNRSSSLICEVGGVDPHGESISKAGTHVKYPPADFSHLPVGSRLAT